MTDGQSAAVESDTVDVPTTIRSLAQHVLSRVSKGCDFNVQIALLASGAYNDVWLVRSSSHPPFVLRVPNADSLQPHQTRNEVGWLAYMAQHCPEIPVPTIFDYSDGSSGDGLAFIAEQYIGAKSLSDVWSTYTNLEKGEVARKVAELVVRLAEMRFDAIGGMTQDGTLGPTVEGCKLFKGRDAFHDPACYDVGPYDSIPQYILAYYDKEIHYHSHADPVVLDEYIFEDVDVADFVQTLREKRTAVEVQLEQNPRSEPFVLCHNDLQGRNILMHGTAIAAVIDWEFAGAFPISEVE